MQVALIDLVEAFEMAPGICPLRIEAGKTYRRYMNNAGGVPVEWIELQGADFVLSTGDRVPATNVKRWRAA